MLRIAILGAGGLGRGMARVIEQRKGFELVALADRAGYCFDRNGIASSCLGAELATVAHLESGVASEHAILELLQEHGTHIDGIFMALPNLPVEFFAETMKMIATRTPFQGVVVDALKRTKAVELLQPLDSLFTEKNITYVTGCGATPGFLTTVAAIAAQSFVEIEHINIHFGVGVDGWEKYRSTVREDILHLPGYNAEKVAAMSDDDIKALLDERGGIIELVNMEHADDIILELAGVCERSKISVGGKVDVRNAKKPCSTTVTVKGITAFGVTSQHQFIVGDETTMVDNVCGPALGFLARGVEYHNNGQVGLYTSAELMPRTSAEGLLLKANMLGLRDVQQETLLIV
jgi:hypothetical protein